MADSTQDNNIELLDQGSAKWKLSTRYSSVTDEHIPLIANRNWAHQLVHEGRMFFLSGRITNLAAAATAYLHGLTDSATVHFQSAALISDGAPLDIGFYEDATIAANGTEIFAVNKNRNASDTHTLRVFTAPTVTLDGTQIESGFLPITGGGNTGGRADLFSTEWILAPSTSYLVKITNNDAQAVDINYNFLWYEVT